MMIYCSSTIDVDIGGNTEIWSPCNIYGCTIGDGCRIGPFVEIQKDVVIGSKVKIGSHTFICSGVTIGDDTFVGHGVFFCNDLFPYATIANTTSLKTSKDWTCLKTVIGNRVSIGTGTVILPGITVGDGALIGAGSVVTKDVWSNTVWCGNPAKFVRLIESEKF